MRTLIALLALSILAPHLEAQPVRVVLDVTPDTRVIAEQESASREVLAPTDREANRVTIIWDGESYRWVTREGRELIYSSGGVFHTFVDPRGGGWVRVLDQSDLPETLRYAGPDIQFFESVSSGLTTLTYWGTASDFNP